MTLMAYKDKEQAKANRQTYQKEHPDRVKASNRTYSQAHKPERKVYVKGRPEQVKASNRTYNQGHRPERNSTNLAYYYVLKAEAFRVLGSNCACPGCEVSDLSFLTIDHIHGRPKGRRKYTLSEAKTSGWDKTQFQILCANCNFAKRDRGFCPVHQKDPGQRNGHSPEGNAQLSLWPEVKDGP